MVCEWCTTWTWNSCHISTICVVCCCVLWCVVVLLCCGLVAWSCGLVVLWCCGVVVLWCCGVVVLWCCGVVVLWCCGVVVLCCCVVVLDVCSPTCLPTLGNPEGDMHELPTVPLHAHPGDVGLCNLNDPMSTTPSCFCCSASFTVTIMVPTTHYTVPAPCFCSGAASRHKNQPPMGSSAPSHSLQPPCLPLAVWTPPPASQSSHHLGLYRAAAVPGKGLQPTGCTDASSSPIHSIPPSMRARLQRLVHAYLNPTTVLITRRT